MAVMRAAILLGCLTLAASGAIAQDQPVDPPVMSGKPPVPFKPDEVSDTWIFSGALQVSHETFSGTLVANKGEAQFEMKLASGATCDGGKLKGDIGLVRLPEITCTDDRAMRALFVPQGSGALKVFGHVGDERFTAEAHLLGTETPAEPKQTAQPKGPLGLPPRPDPGK